MKLTENAEDIIEAIYVISKRKKVVRVKDIANHFNTTNASITMALKSLAQKGLVYHEHYGYIELTEEGERIAKEIYESHKLLYEFFSEILALPPDVAQQDACRIEHYLSKKGLDRILKFIEFIKKCPEESPIWLTKFHYFLEYNKYPDSCVKKEMNLDEIKTLSEIKKNKKAKIIKLSGPAQIKKDLLKKGFIPNAEVVVLSKTNNKILLLLENKKEEIPSDLSNHIHVLLTK